MADLGKLGEARVEIRATTDKLRRDLDQARTKTRVATSGMEKNWEGVRVGLARARNAFLLFNFALTTVGIYVLVRQFKKLWDAAGQQEMALAQLEARIKSTGGAAGKSVAELQAMAAGLQQVTTYGDETILAMQGVLLTFTNIKGDTVRQATEAILDLSAAMYGGTAGGLQQAAIQVGKALHDPIEGVTALRRVGILITEQQREQIKAMVKVGDVAGAQAIILKELQTEFGGTARKLRETPWGEATALGNTFGDTLEILGSNIANILRPAIVKLNKSLADFNAGFDTEKLKELSEIIAKIGKTADEAVLDLDEWVGSTRYVSDQAIDTTVTLETLRNSLIPFGNSFEKAAADVSGFKDALSNAESKMSETAKVIGKLSMVVPDTGAIREELNALYQALDDLEQKGKDWEISWGQSVADSAAVWQVYREERERIEDELAEISEQATERATENIKESFDDMTEFAKQAARNIQNAFADFLFDPFEKGLKGMLEGFLTAMRRMMANIMAKQVLTAIGLGPLLEAHGDVFSGGRVMPMARGAVVNMPTLFPMQRGMGLMGEAGPEAVLPLKRTSGGDLGVKAQPANIRIINAFADDHLADFMNSASGERVILNVIQRNAGAVQRLVGS